MKSVFRSGNFKRRFTLIIFVYNLMMGCTKSIEKIVLKRHLSEEIKKPGFKFNPEFVLMAFRTTGPCSQYISLGAKSVC